MYHYVLLRNPGHNQVFFQQSAPLAVVELQQMDLGLEEIQLLDLAGVSYLAFSRASPLEEEDCRRLAQHSCAYGLFRREGALLAPLLLPSPQVFDRSMATILKYPGKTNEIFTRMLLNLAYGEAGVSPQEARVLDPVAGKGTSMLEAFSLGSQVYGIEIQEKSVSEGYQHLKKFLEKGKYKHKTNCIRFSGANKSFTAKRYQILCQDQEYQLVAGDTKYCSALFPKDYFHVVVGDLPYGVQHGNRAGGLQRSPAQLLHSALGSWGTCLKKTGVLALSWNVLVLPREKMLEILKAKGFVPCEGERWEQISHQVDASILRDIVLAKKG